MVHICIFVSCWKEKLLLILHLKVRCRVIRHSAGQSIISCAKCSTVYFCVEMISKYIGNQNGISTKVCRNCCWLCIRCTMSIEKRKSLDCKCGNVVSWSSVIAFTHFSVTQPDTIGFFVLFSEQLQQITGLEYQKRELTIEIETYKCQIEKLRQELDGSTKDNKYGVDSGPFNPFS